MTPNELIVYSNKAFVLPRLLLLVLFIFTILSIIGLWQIKNSRPLYFGILLAGIIFTSILVGLLILLPIMSQDLITNFINFIS
jgi:hypothetical protein